jgi:hypothetical protein
MKAITAKYHFTHCMLRIAVAEKKELWEGWFMKLDSE